MTDKKLTDRERAREAWDIWATRKYVANPPNDVVAEWITDGVENLIAEIRAEVYEEAYKLGLDHSREDCERLMEAAADDIAEYLNAERARSKKLVEALKVIASMDSPMGFAGCPSVARKAIEEYEKERG